MTVIINGSNTPTAGTVAVGDGTTINFTAAGTAGQVLTSNGAGVPTWTTNGSGTVTTASVVSANGFAGTVATATTTPAITLTTSITGVIKGNGTALSAATAGTDYLVPPSGTALLKANSGGALANAVAGTDYIAPSGALGTPSSGTLTNTTGLPLSTGVTGTLPVANGGTGQTLLSAVSVGTATNLASGSNGTIPYQTASGATAMLAVGTSGQVLQTNGVGAPSWVTVASGLPAATQAEMEAASSNTVSVTPLNTKWHPSVAKLWLKVGALIDSNTIMASYNVTSTTEGTGTLTVTIATDFSSGNYVVVATPQYSQPNNAYDKLTLGVQRGSMAAGSFQIMCVNYVNTFTDPDYYLVTAFGDQ